MNLQPVNPAFPFFTVFCNHCGHSTDSLTAAAIVDEMWCYLCFGCQDPATREAVRLHTNAQVLHYAARFPEMVAAARRRLEIKRPYRVPYDASWAGCGVQS
jgi:hypothetical protein